MRGRLAATVGLVLGLMGSAAHASDGEEISRSKGKKGGVVVLYPRIVPETSDPNVLAVATQLQQQLSAVAQRVVDPKRVDVRPDPQRVCPQEGCKAASLGVMLGHQGGGCAVLVQVGPPGIANQQLFPVAGELALRSPLATFRQPPERLATVTEFAPCTEVMAGLDLSQVELTLGQVAAVAP